MRIVTMSRTGRITVPAETRKELGVEGGTEFEVEVDQESGTLLLHPAIVVRRSDAWTQTPEFRAKIERARRDFAKGRFREMTLEELERLGEEVEGPSNLAFSTAFLDDYLEKRLRGRSGLRSGSRLCC